MILCWCCRKRLAFASVAWIKEICPYQCGWAFFNLLRARKNQKAKEGHVLFLYELEGFPHCPAFFFPCPWTLELLDLGSSDSGTYTRPLASAWELHHQLSWFLDLCTQTIIPLTVLALQFADSRVRDFSVSITMKANSYNKSLIYLYPIFFPLGEPWPIQCLGINQTKYVPDCGGGEIIKFYWKTKEKLY